MGVQTETQFQQTEKRKQVSRKKELSIYTKEQNQIPLRFTHELSLDDSLEWIWAKLCCAILPNRERKSKVSGSFFVSSCFWVAVRPYRSKSQHLLFNFRKHFSQSNPFPSTVSKKSSIRLLNSRSFVFPLNRWWLS